MKKKTAATKIVAVFLAICLAIGVFPADSFATGANELIMETSQEVVGEEPEEEIQEEVVEEPEEEIQEEVVEEPEEEIQEEVVEEPEEEIQEEVVEESEEKIQEEVIKEPEDVVAISDDVEMSVSRINVQGTASGVFELAAAEFVAKGKTVSLVYNESVQAGDVVVYLNGATGDYGAEGYQIEINDTGSVVVTAAENAGAVYGLRDVLKQLEKGSVTAQAITQPFRAFRGLFVDCGRKYFSVAWFEEIIREMAWNNMNTLYLSFSNDEAFRFLLDDMSLSFLDVNGNTVTYDDEFMSHIGDNPSKLSDSAFLTERNANATDNGKDRIVTNYDNNYHLTEKEMIRILSYAKAYGINVIPELNSPGHIGQVLWYFPEYRLVGTWSEDGQPHYGLDLTNPTAANFGAALVKKYVDFFAKHGCTAFCVGGDEYAKGNASIEQVAAYTNGLVEYVESKGMTAYAWNDGQAAKNNSLKNTAIVNNWNGSSSYPSVNFNSDNLYYVLKSNRVWKPNAQNLFETWTPLTFPDGVHADDAKVVGASLAIWCDVPNNETTEQIKANLKPSLQAFGYRMWNFSTVSAAAAEYDTYETFASAVTNAPEVEAQTVLSTAGYAITAGDSVGNAGNVVTPPLKDASAYGYELVSLASPCVVSNVPWENVSDKSGFNLVDGDATTYCQTNRKQQVGDYITVDTGGLKHIETISITSLAGGNGVCKNASVRVSKDGVNWDVVGTYTGDNSPDAYTVNREIRYIQLMITETNGNEKWMLAEISWLPEGEYITSIEDGTYIIVNDVNDAMINKRFNDKRLDIEKMNIENGIIATPVKVDCEWTFTRQNDGTYYIQHSNGKYLRINSDILELNDDPQPFSVEYKGGRVKIYNGEKAVHYSDGFMTNASSGTAMRNHQILYKKIASNGLMTNALREAILTAQGYNNDDNRYGKQQFESLQKILQQSVTLYNDAVEMETSVLQPQIDEQTEALNAAIRALELTDVTEDFIEIPIEMLDFRADGVMFEYEQNADKKGLYELLSDTKFGGWLTYENILVEMPGELGNRLTDDEWKGWNDDCKRMGLVEDYLVDGAPVYKEATVDYIAKLIANGYYTDLSSSVTNWNKAISDKVVSLFVGYDEATDTNSNLGTWKDTLSKTATHLNGGRMEWNSVETCYDLAYYVLHNIWRSTEDVDGEDAYNKRVDAVNTMRLIKDSEGMYAFDSTKEVTYFNEYVYNEDLSVKNNAETKFTPINDLGYESNNEYGDTTDTSSGINFHFTMHARAYFVYNADENLKFYFDGDDDVYFYINGKLAMDIGGAHSHCDNELYLNTIAEEFGLVDGGIYTFDMFYTERHTTQSNLTLQTNIKIMDTACVTTKDQYKVDSDGSIINAVPYGGIVEAEDLIAYSLNLTNLRSVNITNLVFVDERLGTSLSEDGIILSDASKTNGVTTSINDIIVYYHTNDRPAPNADGVINSSTPISKTVSEITEMINTANSNHATLTQGSYKVSVSTEQELQDLLRIGVPYDTQIRIFGIKRKAADTDRPHINIVNTSAVYVAAGKRSTVFGSARQKYTVFNSFQTPVTKQTVVVDYGKTVRIAIDDITRNISCNDGVTATFYGITGNGSHGQIRIDASGIGGTKLEKDYNSAGGNGKFCLIDTYQDDGNSSASEIHFKMNTFLSEVEKVYAAYKVVDTSLSDTPGYEVYYLLVEVDIIPATIVYYETDFAENVFTFRNGANSQNVWNATCVNEVNEIVDSIQNAGTLDPDIYGYDSTYTDSDDAAYSDYHSYVVTGEHPTVTTVNFNFKGTGFDLISSTGEEEGFIRVSVFSDEEKTNLEKMVTVLNKSDRDLTLYQIPVVSIEGLTYGTHYVEIGVSAPKTGGTVTALNNGGRFHFDAIRIYNPIDVSAGFDSTEDALIAYEAYYCDSEADMQLKEVRGLLLGAGDLDSGADSSEPGVVFVDKIANSGVEGVEMADYKTIGPNNEVYLIKNQAIGFKLQSAAIPTSIDIGAKSADGKPVALTACVFAVDNKGIIEDEDYCTISQNINTSTTLFYDLFKEVGKSPAEAFENGSIYIYVANISDEGILSITDLKLAYGEKGTPFEVVSDRASANKTIELAGGEVAKEELEKNYDIIEAAFTKSSFGRNKEATMKVVTTNLVEYLTVANQAGVEQEISSAYELDVEGNKVWTVTFKVKILGKQSYTVTGFGPDGLSGATATADVKVTIR